MALIDYLTQRSEAEKRWVRQALSSSLSIATLTSPAYAAASIDKELEYESDRQEDGMARWQNVPHSSRRVWRGHRKQMLRVDMVAMEISDVRLFVSRETVDDGGRIMFQQHLSRRAELEVLLNSRGHMGTMYGSIERHYQSMVPFSSATEYLQQHLDMLRRNLSKADRIGNNASDIWAVKQTLSLASRRDIV